MSFLFGTLGALALVVWLVAIIALAGSAMDHWTDENTWWRWWRPLAAILLLALGMGAIVSTNPPYCPYTCRRMVMIGKVMTQQCDWECARRLDDAVPVGH